MKNKFKIILKNNLINTYKLISTSKKKLVLILLLVIYIFSSTSTCSAQGLNSI